MMYDYATARKFNPAERMLYSAAARDQRVARAVEAFGTRHIGPARMFATAVPLALAAHARRSLSSGRGLGARPTAMRAVASDRAAPGAPASGRATNALR
jgi:hypothetical protein